MHYHAYTSRVPGMLANGSPESEPEHPMFRASTVPPRLIRRWLLRDPAKVKAKTFDTPDAATAWLAKWIEENPRPGSGQSLDEQPDDNEPRLACYERYEQRLRSHAPAGATWPLTGPQRRVAFAGNELTNGQDVVDGFYTAGGEYVAAYLIPCPARDISGFPASPPCPVGRH